MPVWNFRKNDRVCFTTVDSDLESRNGDICTVVRRLTRREADLYETGPMYEVRFDDGEMTGAFEDELALVRRLRTKGETVELFKQYEFDFIVKAAETDDPVKHAEYYARARAYGNAAFELENNTR